ncbi:MAG: hypothetical protein O2782_23755, partial [bacterium]|nr:hypothetical protein [bacterium]
VSGDGVEYIAETRIDDAAPGPDGAIYATQETQVLRFDLFDNGPPEDVTVDFGGAPQGQGRVIRGPGGEIFVEGCRRYRQLKGTFAEQPAATDGTIPLPLAADLYGNRWSLVAHDGRSELLVLAASAPATWQVVPMEDGLWEHLVVDCDGFLWIAGPKGVRCFWPRDDHGKGWQTPTGAAGSDAIHTLGLSPDGRVLVPLGSGELVQLDIDATGRTIQQSLGQLASLVRCLHTDAEGTIWAAGADGLYRQPAPAPTWHLDWEQQPGRLPGGGNHDIFAVPWQGRLFMAGGLTRRWGYPTRERVFDELFAFDPASGCWDVVSHMPFPRRYNGISELDGRIWIIGGEGEPGARDGERTTLDVVDIYDPSSGAWTPGPRLHQVRTDPFVMASGGRIWAVGGACDPTTKLQSVESIGSGERSWRAEPDLPEPTRQGGCCALRGVLYVISIDGFFAFDTATGCWEQDLPQPGAIGQAPLVAAYADEVWMMGGLRCAATRCYHPATRTWRDGPRLPTEQSWGAAAGLDGSLYITGGAHRCDMHDATIYDDRTWTLRR